MTAKTAQNQLGELKRLGLLNDDGQLTEAAHKLRTDDGFQEGCHLLIKHAFPEQMVEAFSGRIPEESEVIKFLMNRGRGEGVAKQAAGLFLFLVRGVPVDARAPRRVGPKTTLRPSSDRPQSPTNGGGMQNDKPTSAVDAIDSPAPSNQVQTNAVNALFGPATETLRYWLGEGRTVEVRIPKDITRKEMRRLMGHLKLDLEEIEEGLGE